MHTKAQDAEDNQNLYLRGNVWFARLWLDGRDVRRSLRTGDRRLALKRLSQLKKEFEAAPKPLDPTEPMWITAVVAWHAHAQSNIASGTLKRYRLSLKQVSPFLKDLALSQINRAVLAAVVRERKASDASNATIRRDLTAISSVIDHAISNEWMDSNPTLVVRRTLKERRDPIILPDPRHIEFVIAMAPGALGDLIWAAWKTGCRQNELVTVERRHLDHARKVLAVYKTKRSRPRFIQLDDETYDRLAALPEAENCPYLFHHDGKKYQNVSTRWGALTARCLRWAKGKGRVMAESGTPTGTGRPLKSGLSHDHTVHDFRRFRFHDLRHAHAVDYLRTGNIYDLSKRLGHTSVKTTEIYLEYLTPEEANKAKHMLAQTTGTV